MSDALTRDEAHVYRVNGAEHISVTQAIREGGLMGDLSFLTPESRDRGAFVHQACEWDDSDDLDEDTLDPALGPYVAAYRRFKREACPTWTLIEAMRHDDTLKYAGTVDRAGTLKGQKHPTVLDIKSGAEAPWHAVQLSAYKHLLTAELGPIVTRHALYLRSDGSYRLDSLPLNDREDWDTFCHCLGVAHWKRTHLA